MSKHEKQVRRERKKINRARRRSFIRHPKSKIQNGAAAFAAAVAIAGATQAYADPVRFDNPAGAGHFDWTTSPGQDALDITRDAASQPGADAALPATFLRYTWYYGSTVYGQRNTVPVTDEMQLYNINGYDWLVGVDAGVSIPTPGLFREGGTGGFIHSDYYFAVYSAGTDSFLPEGAPTYLGVRFDLGGGTQYGWIGVVRSGPELDAFAWGYETTPGVPIPAGAPEPGSLALLAFGAVGITATRRRRCNS